MYADSTASTPNNKHVPPANHIPSEVSVSSDASLTLKGLCRSVSLIRLFFYIIFPRAVRLHAPGFCKGGSTVNIRPKMAPSCVCAFVIIGCDVKHVLPFSLNMFLLLGFWKFYLTTEKCYYFYNKWAPYSAFMLLSPHPLPPFSRHEF
jgi:hypothetical protein